jgi:hypothetical protein
LERQDNVTDVIVFAIPNKLNFPLVLETRESETFLVKVDPFPSIFEFLVILVVLILACKTN